MWCPVNMIERLQRGCTGFEVLLQKMMALNDNTVTSTRASSANMVSIGKQFCTRLEALHNGVSHLNCSSLMVQVCQERTPQHPCKSRDENTCNFIFCPTCNLKQTPPMYQIESS